MVLIIPDDAVCLQVVITFWLGVKLLVVNPLYSHVFIITTDGVITQVSVHCYPNIELLAVKCRWFSLHMEFTSTIIMVVYTLPMQT